MADSEEELASISPLDQLTIPRPKPDDDIPTPPDPDDDDPNYDDDPDPVPDDHGNPNRVPDVPERPAALADDVIVERYQSRIHIVDAWKYPGSLVKRPDFVDPGWASWAEYDDKTKRPAGPALRVPTSGPQTEKMCRKGDYVVRQLVTIDHSQPADAQVDVWTEAEFERLFIPAKIQ